ncbi:MAG: HAD family hydrolase [Bdellovibrionota bacterium]
MISHPLLIFDLDGTLVEFPRDYIFSQTDRILAELGHPPVTAEEMLHAFCLFDFFSFVQDPNRKEFIDRYWRSFDWVNYPKPSPLEGAASVLAELKQRGHTLALATARLDPVAELRDCLLATGFLDHLDHLECRPGEHVEWTDKTGHIDRICRKFGVSPQQAVFVGDIPADVKSAKLAGVGVTVAVLSGGIYRSVLEAAEPDHILDDVRHLLTLGF